MLTEMRVLEDHDGLDRARRWRNLRSISVVLARTWIFVRRRRSMLARMMLTSVFRAVLGVRTADNVHSIRHASRPGRGGDPQMAKKKAAKKKGTKKKAAKKKK